MLKWQKGYCHRLIKVYEAQSVLSNSVTKEEGHFADYLFVQSQRIDYKMVATEEDKELWEVLRKIDDEGDRNIIIGYIENIKKDFIQYRFTHPNKLLHKPKVNSCKEVSGNSSHD